MDTKVIDNSASNAASGAGVSAAQTIAEEGVEAVISQNFGPKAFDSLKAGALKLYSFSGKKVKEAVEKFKQGTLEELSAPTNKPHSGLNR